MAQSRQKLLERKRELVLKLDASRQRVAAGSKDLRRGFSLSHIVSSYLQRHPLQIFGATSLGVGLLTWILRPRTRPEGQKPPKSLTQRLAGWIISFLKGSIRNWLLTQARDYLRTKQS
jgi:hypothetical protein